ncbi:ABC-type transport auxiliary lipoprotein family protein [Edaphobacter aggregans]|uniref:ABC-type transport auxiliary lipoprotein family protein n=1 Tax=Edaphobacter aggregans TaxID=570835 RepID=UPI00055523BE|nr:ABC-type transport auxiliary lipoprotein family protein [Edaphobacter aggregans]
MIRVPRLGFCLLLTIACLGAVACRLRRPDTAPTRMIEPQLLEPQLPEPARQVTKVPNAAAVRLLDTQARGHIGRRVLHQQPDGELTEDSVWRWSSAPDRYLDTALRIEVASSPAIRLVDAGRAPALAATLLVWDLESAGGTRLVGAVEFQITGTDRVVHTQVVRASEPVSAELPGDLAASAGRLLRRLASEGLKGVANER